MFVCLQECKECKHEKATKERRKAGVGVNRSVWSTDLQLGPWSIWKQLGRGTLTVALYAWMHALSLLPCLLGHFFPVVIVSGWWKKCGSGLDLGLTNWGVNDRQLVQACIRFLLLLIVHGNPLSLTLTENERILILRIPRSCLNYPGLNDLQCLLRAPAFYFLFFIFFLHIESIIFSLWRTMGLLDKRARFGVQEWKSILVRSTHHHASRSSF